jgi:hemolysin activation/secretion protein
LFRRFTVACIAIGLSQIVCGADLTGITPGLSGEMLEERPEPAFQKNLPLINAPSNQTSSHQLPPEANHFSLTLSRVIFKGNHTFTTSELEKIFIPYLNKKITLEKLQELVEEVTKKYHSEGYFLSKAILPPQNIDNGLVNIQILEGFISEVKIHGINNPEMTEYLQQYAKKITEQQPAKLSNLEYYLLIMNDISGFTLKSVLEPDNATPLGTTLNLVTTYTPAQFEFSEDNYQTRYLGTYETAFYSSFNSLVTPGGTLNTHISFSDTFKDLSFYKVDYGQTIGTDGLVWHLSGYITKTNPAFTLSPLDINGTSNEINTYASYPILRSRSRNLNFTGEFEIMNNSEKILGSKIYSDTLLNLIATLNYNDHIWNGSDTFQLSITKGLPNKSLLSRTAANSDFIKISATASREQYLTDIFSIYSSITSQYANIVLPAVEVITYGGAYIGRGYDLAQFTGDNGIEGTVELHANTNTDFYYAQQIQYILFYDIGKLYSLIPNVTDVSGASFGAGIKTAITENINLYGFVGQALTNKNATQVVSGYSGHQPVLYFQINLIS